MKEIKKNFNKILLVASILIMFFVFQGSMFAAPGQHNPVTAPERSSGVEGYTPPEGSECTGNSANCCNGVVVSLGVACTESDNPAASYLYGVMNVMAGGVGIVIVAVIVYSGIEMITAKGQPDKIQQGKKRLTNAIVALLGFIFLYAFLQWLIPGGIGG